jgi:hypothetical protein
MTSAPKLPATSGEATRPETVAKPDQNPTEAVRKDAEWHFDKALWKSTGSGFSFRGRPPRSG